MEIYTLMNRIYVLIPAFIILICAIVISCRKDNRNVDDGTDQLSQEIEVAKIYHLQNANLNTLTYNSLLVKSKMSSVNRNNTGSVKTTSKVVFYKLSPQWKKAYILTSEGGKHLLIVPTIDNPLSNKDIQVRRFFMFSLDREEVLQGRIIEILGFKYPLEENIKSILEKFDSPIIHNLTGGVFEYDMNYFLKKGEVIQDGHRTGIDSKLSNLPSATKVAKLSSSRELSSGTPNANSQKLMDGWQTGIPDWTGCSDLYWCQGDTGQAGITCTWSGYASNCFGTGTQPVGSDSGYDTSGQGGGGGSYGGNPAIPTVDCAGVAGGSARMADCGCIGGTTGIVQCSKDPCKEKANISALASQSGVATAKASALTKTTTTGIEHGYDTKLNSLSTNTYKAMNVRPGSSSSSFSPQFTWNATDGYSIGATHGHPGGSAPSPADIIWAARNVSSPSLIAGGTTAVNTYKASVSVTTLTQASTYVVTVKDWAALQALLTAYDANPTQANANYVQAGQDYLNGNPFTATNETASAYAALKLYGSAVNIYKAATGTNTFSPIALNSVDVVDAKPCP